MPGRMRGNLQLPMRMSEDSDPLPVIIGVDPGSQCGWAVFLPGKRDERYYLWRYGQAKPTRTTWVHSLLVNVIEKAGDRRVVMAIEGQYLPQGYGQESGFRMSQKSVIGLVLNRARWQVVAELLGIEVLPRSPLKWQADLLGASNKVPSEERKMRANKFAKSYFGICELDEHETDAICVATHEARLKLIPIAQHPRPDKGERRSGKKV